MNLGQSRDFSLALWVPFIWYAIIASRGVSRWLTLSGYEPGDLSYLEGSPIDRAVYIVLIFLGIVILMRRRIEWHRVLKDNKWLVVLFIYMLLSISWSQFPEVSFKRWIRAAGDLIMVLVVISEPNPIEAISRVLRRCFYIHLSLSIILIKYFRTIGVGWDDSGAEMWTGVTIHKNLLGEVCMISGIFFVWSILRNRGMRRFIDFGFLLMALWLLRGSGSHMSITAIVAFSFGIGSLFALQIGRSRVKYLKKYLVTASIVLAVGLLGAGLAVEAFSGKSFFATGVQASGRDTTLTGRTELWQDILNIASNHPMLGAGYGSFWIGNLGNNLWERHVWKPSSGHNGYLDVYVELGIVGVFFLLLVIISSFRQIVRTFESNFEYGRFQLVFFLMILLHNIAESSFLRGASNLWFIFLFVAMTAPEILRGSRPSKTHEIIAT